jgi:hypothetical protein
MAGSALWQDRPRPSYPLFHRPHHLDRQLQHASKQQPLTKSFKFHFTHGGCIRSHILPPLRPSRLRTPPLDANFNRSKCNTTQCQPVLSAGLKWSHFGFKNASSLQVWPLGSQSAVLFTMNARFRGPLSRSQHAAAAADPSSAPQPPLRNTTVSSSSVSSSKNHPQYNCPPSLANRKDGKNVIGIDILSAAAGTSIPHFSRLTC